MPNASGIISPCIAGSAVLGLLLFASCEDHLLEPVTLEQPVDTTAAAPLEGVTHTVLAYIAAENSLASYLYADFREMMAGRSAIPRDAQLLVFIDDRQQPRLYRIASSQQADTVRLHTWNTDICSTDSMSMASVLEYVQMFSPSTERFDLVMSSHASGWIPQTGWKAAPMRRTFGIDNNENSNSNQGTEMNIADLHDVIYAKLGHVGYIFFDACYMQCIEVAHQLRDVADYIVASPTEIPGTGADYTNMMPMLFAGDKAHEQIVEQYYADELAKNANGAGVVLSAIETSQTPLLAERARPIVAQLLYDRTTPSATGVQLYGVYDYTTMYRPTFYDMWGLAQLTTDEEALLAFRDQLDSTVVSYRATSTWGTIFKNVFTPSIPDITRTCGVTMFIPDERYEAQDWNNLYHNTPWYTAAGYDQTGW